jgi:hypothetical protein
VVDPCLGDHSNSAKQLLGGLCPSGQNPDEKPEVRGFEPCRPCFQATPAKAIISSYLFWMISTLEDIPFKNLRLFPPFIPKLSDTLMQSELSWKVSGAWSN